MSVNSKICTIILDQCATPIRNLQMQTVFECYVIIEMYGTEPHRYSLKMPNTMMEIQIFESYFMIISGSHRVTICLKILCLILPKILVTKFETMDSSRLLQSLLA